MFSGVRVAHLKRLRGGVYVHQYRSARMTVCPACKQANSGEPRGFVYLDGAFFVGHLEEIKNLLLNEAKRAGKNNPLARVVELKEDDGHKLTVTTTTEHLAQCLGHAVGKSIRWRSLVQLLARKQGCSRELAERMKLRDLKRRSPLPA